MKGLQKARKIVMPWHKSQIKFEPLEDAAATCFFHIVLMQIFRRFLERIELTNPGCVCLTYNQGGAN